MGLLYFQLRDKHVKVLVQLELMIYNFTCYVNPPQVQASRLCFE